MTNEIWILITTPNYSSKAILQEGRKKGLEIFQHNPDEFTFLSDRKNGDVLFHKNKIIDFPRAVITRNNTGRSYHSSQFLSVLEKNGTYCMNTAQSIEYANDKWLTIHQLDKKNISHPRSMLIQFPTDIKLVKKYFTRPVIVKRTTGKGGKGLILVKDRTQMEDLFNVLEQSVNTHSHFLLQEFIKASAGQDIRVIVIGGKAIAALKRKGKKNKFQSNVGLGGKAEIVTITKDMEHIAEQATAALGLDFAGVDLLVTDEGYTVCEVNASPGGFKNFKDIAKINIAKQLVNHVMKKSKK